MQNENRRKRMLSVQAYPPVNLMIRLYFEENCNMDVVPVETGTIAHALVQADPHFDLIVTGMNLRGLDGYGLTRSLRALGYESPIIGFSSLFERDPSVIAALKSGMNHYVLKPNYGKLVTLIKEYGIIDVDPFEMPEA